MSKSTNSKLGSNKIDKIGYLNCELRAGRAKVRIQLGFITAKNISEDLSFWSVEVLNMRQYRKLKRLGII